MVTGAGGSAVTAGGVKEGVRFRNWRALLGRVKAAVGAEEEEKKHSVSIASVRGRGSREGGKDLMFTFLSRSVFNLSSSVIALRRLKRTTLALDR